MDIRNQIVIHKAFGEGEIIKHEGTSISVLFNQGEKKFIYPDSFKDFLKAKDESVNAQIQDELAEIERQKAAEQQEKQLIALIEKERMSQKQTQKDKQPKVKIYPRENIAFKCNFCDGGKTSDSMGFNGVCSEEMIRYNIGKTKHVWCSQPACFCRQFYEGSISSYEELLNTVSDHDGYVCNESIMLRDWKADAGWVHTGKRKGTPMSLKKVQTNSLAVLTTRLPNETEKNRFVFAVFLVDDSYEGDARAAGYVSTESKYKIQMTPNEAQKIKFWDYYFCVNAPDVIKFGSGLHRYLSDGQAAQILRDIARVKKGTEQEELAQEFFEHFCKINGVDIADVSQNNGALMR